MKAKGNKFCSIEETQGRYLVNKNGFLLNKKRGNKLYGYPRTNGYLSVTVYDTGQERPMRLQIHRLVAEYFIPNPNNYPCVLHLDDDKTNNHYKNLAWGTYEMNSQDMVNKGRHKNQHSKTIKVYEG